MTTEFQLRPGVDLIRSGPDQYLLMDAASGRHFELTARERLLLEWLRRGEPPEAILRLYAERFGETLSRRTLLDFAEQLREAGLVASGRVVAPETSGPSGSAAVANCCFDVLAVLLGWMVHPWWWWAGTALALWMAASAVCLHWSAFKSDLHESVGHLPMLERVVLTIGISAFVIGLFRAVATGLTTRVLGGRIAAFRLQLYRNVLPSFRCDTGDTYALADDRDRWMLLTCGLVAHAWLASAFAVAWIAVRDAGRPAGGLAVLAAVAFMMLLFVGVIRDGYAILCHLVEDGRVLERAEAERAAWFGFRASPEPLSRRERFWLRLFGLFLYVAKPLVYVLVFGVGGYHIALESGGFGALVVLTAAALWFGEEIKGMGMAAAGAIGLTRFGGKAWFRWTVRFSVIVILMLVGFIPYNHEIAGTCRVSSVTQHGLRAQIAAEILEVIKGDGDAVHPGDRVVVLNDRDVKATVEEAEVALERAQADLSLKEQGPRTEDVEAARQQMELSRLKFVFSTNELARAESLYRDGGITPEEYDQARFGRDSAEKELLIAEQSYMAKTNGSRPEEIQAARAAVRAAEVDLAHSRMQLSLLQVTSRVGGVVSTPYLKGRMGQVVQPGDLIAVVQDPTNLLIEMAASVTAASYVRTGMPVNVRLYTTHGELVRGHVLGVAPKVDSDRALRAQPFRSDKETHLETSVAGGGEDGNHVLVQVSIDETPAPLQPGMTGYARIVIAEDCFWRSLYRPILGFFRTEVWSWLP